MNLNPFIFFILGKSISSIHRVLSQSSQIKWATNGTEIEVEITNSEGGEEFCGSELEEAEAPDFTYTLDEDVIIGDDTIPAGVYSDIHCEEHAH